MQQAWTIAAAFSFTVKLILFEQAEILHYIRNALGIPDRSYLIMQK